MSDAALANERAASELPFAETSNENAADGLSEVKSEPLEDDYQGDDDIKVKDENVKIESKDQKDGVPVKLKRKGRRGRSSGTLTMKGDKITSFTTERGVTYAPNGMLSNLSHVTRHSVLGVSDQVQHKPGFTAIKLEILDLGSGVV